MKKPVCFALAAVFATALGGCSSDDDDNDSPAATALLSGTAAKGAPIIGTVSATGANGVVATPVTIGADGSYSLNVNGLTAPFIIVADEDGTSELFFSYADAVNVIANVTPLTTLALAMSGNGDPADLLANWQAQHTQVTPTEITNAAQQVYANLQTQMTANGVTPDNFDIFREPFAVGATGIDDVLDEIQEVDLDFTDPTNPVFTITPITGTPLPVQELPIANIDFVDGDGVLGADDRCITADGNLSADFDDDGCDDANEDTDDDGDGVIDTSDSCATDDNNLSADVDADGCDDEDEDDSVDTDTTAPVLTVHTAVSTPSTNTQPIFIVTSNEAGTLIYAGDCSSTRATLVAGNNEIVFNELAVGVHANCTISVMDEAGNTSNVLAVPAFTIEAPSTGNSCDSGDSTLPAAIKGQVVTLKYAANPSVSGPYTDGIDMIFSFCQNGSLMITHNNTVVATSFTTSNPSETVSIINWVGTDQKFEVVLLNGALHEVNLMNADGSVFYGQFAADSGPVVGEGDWTLTISGQVCTIGICNNVPETVVLHTVAPSMENVQSTVNNAYPGYGATVTVISDTATLKSYRIQYSVTQAGFLSTGDLVYSYSLTNP